MQGAITLFATQLHKSAFDPQRLEGVTHGFTLLREQAGHYLYEPPDAYQATVRLTLHVLHRKLCCEPSEPGGSAHLL